MSALDNHSFAHHQAARATGEDLIGACCFLLQGRGVLPAMAILAPESILLLQGKSYGASRPSVVPG